MAYASINHANPATCKRRWHKHLAWFKVRQRNRCLGLIPLAPAVREFVDELGLLNQALAPAAQVLLLAAGLPGFEKRCINHVLHTISSLCAPNLPGQLSGFS